MLIRRFRASWQTPWQRMLYILFIAQVMTGIGFSSIFPFLPLYVKALGARSGLSLDLLAGLVFSVQAFTMMLSAPLWGMVADRYGRKLMVERSQFGGVLILGAMAFAQSAEDLVLLRALQGLITGTVAAVNALVAASAPREHTGYAMGFVQVGLGLGVALGPLMGGAIADAYGYSATFYVTAVLLLLSGITVRFWVHEPPRIVLPSVKESAAPGSSQAATGNPHPVPGNPHPAPVNSQAAAAAETAAAVPKRPGFLRRGFFRTWGEILTSPGVRAVYALSFLNQLSRNMLLPVVPLFVPLLLHGSSLVNTFTGLVAGASSATTTLSSGYLGRLGDRKGQRRVLIVALLVAGLLFAVQAAVQSGWQLLLMQGLVGVALGGITPAISALLARTTRPGLEGAVYGLENAVGSGARSVAPMLGSIIMLWWGLRSTFLVSGGLLLLTALFAALALPDEPRE